MPTEPQAEGSAGAPAAQAAGTALLTLCVLLVAVYLASGSGRLRTIDEAAHFAVTESVAKRGAFDINTLAWVRWSGEPGGVPAAIGAEGDLFALQGPAPSLLAAPLYLIGWASGALPAGLQVSMLQTGLWLNAIVTALAAALLARLVLALGCRPAAAIGAGLLYGLGTAAWPYATGFTGEPLSALAVLSLFYALLRLRRTGATAYAAWAGISAAMLVATCLAHAVLLIPFGIYLVYAAWSAPAGEPQPAMRAGWRLGWRRALRVLAAGLSFLIPLAYAAGLLAWYDWVRFGTVRLPDLTGVLGAGSVAAWPLRLWGLLFGSHQGLFWTMPLAVAGLAAWPGFVRRHKAEGSLLAAVILVCLLAGAGLPWWEGTGLAGFARGPAWLVPLAPLLVLPLSGWLDGGLRRTGLRAGLAVVAVLSVIVQGLAVAVHDQTALPAGAAPAWSDPPAAGWLALADPAHSSLLGQLRLLLEDAAGSAAPGWLAGGRIVWLIPAAAAGVVLLAGLAWTLSARRRMGWSRAAAALALVGTSGLAGLAPWSYAAWSPHGLGGTATQSVLEALAEIEWREGPQDGIVTAAPQHREAVTAYYRGRLPVYGFATGTDLREDEPEALLWRALQRHERLWLVTEGGPPAAAGDTVQAWLAQQAFIAEERDYGGARLAAFVAASRLQPLPVYATLAGGVRLIAARASDLAVRPGGVVAVSLTWQADAGADLPASGLRGFLQLVSPDGRVVAAQGWSAWEAGTAVEDRRGLLLPSDLAPGDYSLIAGLYDAGTGRRLAVSPGVESILIASVRVE